MTSEPLDHLWSATETLDGKVIGSHLWPDVLWGENSRNWVRSRTRHLAFTENGQITFQSSSAATIKTYNGTVELAIKYERPRSADDESTTMFNQEEP